MGKIGKIIYYAIVILLVLGFFGTVLSGSGPKGAEFGLTIGMWLTIICLIAAIVSSVIFLINNTSRAKNMLIGGGVLVLVSVICYVVSPGTLEMGYAKYGVETVALSKRIDMGLYLSAFLTLVAVGAIIVSEGVALFKN
jgi:hypothetical protein